MGIVLTQGSGGIDPSGVTVDHTAVISGGRFITSSGELDTGTMPYIGGYSTAVPYGGQIQIPYGFHDGSGIITAGAFPFEGIAQPWMVLEGATFYGNSAALQAGALRNLANASFDIASAYEGDNGVFVLVPNLPNGAFINNTTVIPINMEVLLSSMFGSSDDRYGNVIRKGPSTSYSTASFHYTGRSGGSGDRWKEVVVYGWQYNG